MRLYAQGNLLLSDVWFQPDKALSAGIEPLIRGYVASPRGVVEPRFSAAVQQNLFGPSNINGSDLFSINIQRGRDHGLPDYNTCRWGGNWRPGAPQAVLRKHWVGT